MSSKPPSAVASIAQNRLHITIGGRLSRENLDKLYTEVRFCVADLTPGFGVITDLSDCKIAALSGVSTFRKIANYLIINRVGRVVRVVDENRVVVRQLVNLTARMQGYKADHFHSLAEAEAALTSSARRDSLRFVLHQHLVTFSMDGLENNGFVGDISTSGCAVQTTGSIDRLPAVLDKVSISILFTSREKMMDALESSAEVIWVGDDGFGVKFLDMSNEQKEQLWERLVYESNNELP